MSAIQTLATLRANRPQSIDDVDEWLARYMAAGEKVRAEAAARERLNDAAPELLACLENAAMNATGERRARYLAAIAKATGGAA